MQADDATREAERALRLCAACLFCDDYCAVFPAIAGKHDYSLSDLGYLANLCHNCRGCYHACQYAPPHEFAVNVPQAMATVRGQTYADYAWPAPLGQLYQRNGLTLSVALAAGLALFIWLAADATAGAKDFYAISFGGLQV